MTRNEELFIYSATHCSTNLGLAYTTIKLYLCGIRNVYIELGKGDTFMIGNKPVLKLQLLLKGIKKAKRQSILTRFPIAGDLLHAMCNMLSHPLFGPYLDALMWEVITMFFMAFQHVVSSRVSVLTLMHIVAWREAIFSYQWGTVNTRYFDLAEGF